MTTHLVTFSDESMSRSREVCVQSAITNGVQQVFSYGPWDVQKLDCYEANRKVFDAPRGCGYWAFKPALLNRILGLQSFLFNVAEGDVVIWADAGIEFINNVNYIIDRMDQDIFLFGNNWEHAHWCKRDVIDEIFSADRLPDFTHWALPAPWKMFSKQVQASVIFFRVSDYTRKFVKEWLDWCLFEGGGLIDDSPSRTPNHPEFREHRHDQAILTTLAYREGLRLHWWPSVYNKGGSPEFIYERGDYPDDGYPVLFSHHRKRNHEWSEAA